MIGLFYDELDVGQCFELGQYQFTEENTFAFSSTFTPVGFQLDADAAGFGLFGKKSAAGFHICSAWMACFVATNQRERKARAMRGEVLPEIGPSPGLECITWYSPVFAGDTVTYSTEILALRVLNSKPAWGLLTASGAGKKLSGEVVLGFRSHILVARR